MSQPRTSTTIAAPSPGPNDDLLPPWLCLDCDEPVDPDDTTDPLYCGHCAGFRAWYYGADH
ncbi:MAG TPA: hypothetical protein VGH76_11675 [Actinomycetospora sp.]|jgi:hypothetical protein|uniref:hypothetical protein n=1 Tax=Actinomycetospora sp. TaxID=1872135 RepID=UPI002F41F329